LTNQIWSDVFIGTPCICNYGTTSFFMFQTFCLKDRDRDLHLYARQSEKSIFAIYSFLRIWAKSAKINPANNFFPRQRLGGWKHPLPQFWGRDGCI